jgi:membrane-bound lytic murein transglycosylase F
MHCRRLAIPIVTVLCLFAGCVCEQRTIDLDEIRERGEIIAITSYSPLSYFIYRGQPMGYEYELLQLAGEYLDIAVTIKLARDIDGMIDMLNNGEGDLIAYGLTITAERRDQVAFTHPLNITRQVLVQRKPENWRNMQLHQIERELIRSPIDLAGKQVHVRKGSAYVTRLHNLSREIGGDIEVTEAPGEITTEDLIRQVSDGSIELTVADENIARIKAAYYRDIDVDTPVSLPQQTAWAVRHTSKSLLEALNQWLAAAQNDAEYYVIYNKYYENRRAFAARYESEYFPVTGGSISPYDDILRTEAERLGWDWRLLAALVYQESQFRPRARSWAGAVGLMQLMPRTAREFGATDLFDPEQNIRAGVNFIDWLDTYWSEDIRDAHERLKFVIASYNVGQGHVQDARRLAEAFGSDPNVWKNNVEHYMMKKSDPEYYNMEIVNFGYASGTEPVTYVDTIFNLYQHYTNFIE